jgi:hypothetical protein
MAGGLTSLFFCPYINKEPFAGLVLVRFIPKARAAPFGAALFMLRMSKEFYRIAERIVYKATH